MHLNFGPNGTIQLDGAKICFRNFAGRKDAYNTTGKRKFSVIINDEEIKEALVNNLNRYGVGWNVKIKPPREEGDEPFMFMDVNVKFNRRGPDIYVMSGNNPRRLDEETVGELDEIAIDHVDLDIRPYDDTVRGEPFRSAYLQGIWVYQKMDRFAERFARMHESGDVLDI